jgi:hypothetical protein
MPFRRRPGKGFVKLPVSGDHSRFFGHRQGEVQAVVKRLAGRRRAFASEKLKA